MANISDARLQQLNKEIENGLAGVGLRCGALNPHFKGSIETLLLLSQLSETVRGTTAYQAEVSKELDRLRRWSTSVAPLPPPSLITHTACV